MMRTWGRATLLALLVLFGAGGAACAKDWSVSSSSSEMSSHGYAPLYLDITNPRQQRLQIQIDSNDSYRSNTRFHYSCPVSSGDNASFRLEFPLPAVGDYSIKIKQEGGGEERLSFNPSNRYYYGGANIVYYVVDGVQLRELSDFLEKAKKAGTGTSAEARSIRAAALPERWQSYAGLDGVIVLGVKDIAKLNTRQKEALTDWVSWGSGRLWLFGKGDRGAAGELGLALSGNERAVGANISCYHFLTGEVWLKEGGDFAGWGTPCPPALTGPISPLNFDNLNFPGSKGLLANLGVISEGVIIALLLLFGVLIGPVNYFYIRRKNSPLLFFLTTPLLAALGSLSVFGFSALSEGGKAKYNEAALLMQEGGSERAALIHARGIYSGIFNRSLQYPQEALLYPFRKNTLEDGDFSAELSGGIRLTSGWITPRVPSGILGVVPVTARMGVELRREGEKIFALNTLSYTLTHLAVALPRGRSGWALEVKPGERRELTVGLDQRILNELQGRLSGYFGGQPYGTFPVIAECAGLPYLDDAGLDGVKLSGVYFYLASWNDPASPLVPAPLVKPGTTLTPAPPAAAKANPAKGVR